jgi:hypothetical protein
MELITLSETVGFLVMVTVAYLPKEPKMYYLIRKSPPQDRMAVTSLALSFTLTKMLQLVTSI